MLFTIIPFHRVQHTEVKVRAFPCLLANIANVSAEGTSEWSGLACGDV